MAIPVPPQTETAARSLEFLAPPHGPLVAVPRMVVHAWRGYFDVDGEPDLEGDTDYARACALRALPGLIPVGDGHGLVLPTNQATSYYPTAEGGLLIRRIGGSAPALLGAALGVRTGWSVLPEIWHIPRGGVVLISAATWGRDLGPGDAVDMPLSTGTYAIELLRSWEGDVIRSRGVEEVMLQAFRLRRILRAP